MGECFGGLSEAERIRQRIKRLQTDKDCLELARDIYRYIEEHPSSALEGKRITITPAHCLEAKQLTEKKK